MSTCRWCGGETRGQFGACPDKQTCVFRLQAELRKANARTESWKEAWWRQRDLEIRRRAEEELALRQRAETAERERDAWKREHDAVDYVLEKATEEAAAHGMIRGTESLREFLGGVLPTLKRERDEARARVAELEAEAHNVLRFFGDDYEVRLEALRKLVGE